MKDGRLEVQSIVHCSKLVHCPTAWSELELKMEVLRLSEMVCLGSILGRHGFLPRLASTRTYRSPGS